MPLLPSYKNQSIDLHSKSTDWFLYEGYTGFSMRATVVNELNTTETLLNVKKQDMQKLIAFFILFVVFNNTCYYSLSFVSSGNFIIQNIDENKNIYCYFTTTALNKGKTGELLITNYHALFHLQCKEILLKYQNVSKYYDHDCLQSFLLLFKY